MRNNCGEWITQLAERYADMVFATVYRILGDPNDAEDAFQDVFLKIMASGKRGSVPEIVGDWGSYLRVVATRSAIDLRRRRILRSRNRVALTEEIRDAAAQTPDVLASQRQKAEALREAMTLLTERDALVFALRCFEDFSYEDIARQAGINVNQVGVILHRARKVLQDALGPQEHTVARDMTKRAK